MSSSRFLTASRSGGGNGNDSTASVLSGLSSPGGDLTGSSRHDESIGGEFASSYGSDSDSDRQSRCGDEKDGEDDKKSLDPTQMRKNVRKLGSVDKLWLVSDELKFDSDADISDMSEVWSEYGDQVSAATHHTKMTRWNPTKKTVSERLSDRNAALQSTNGGGSSRASPTGGGTTIRKRSKRKKATVENKMNKVIHGMSFVPIGKTKDPSQGIYYLDFSPHFKRCLKLARDKAEEDRESDRERRRSSAGLDSEDGAASPGGGQADQLTPGFKARSMRSSISSRKSSRSTSPFPLSETSAAPSSAQGSGSQVKLSPAASSIFKSLGIYGGGGDDEEVTIGAGGGDINPFKGLLGPQKPMTAAEKAAAKEGGLGPRWPKGMWDNMDSRD